MCLIIFSVMQVWLKKANIDKLVFYNSIGKFRPKQFHKIDPRPSLPTLTSSKKSFTAYCATDHGCDHECHMIGGVPTWCLAYQKLQILAYRYL
jgi:hypothetical protein